MAEQGGNNRPSGFAGLLEFNTGKIALGGHRGMGANVWTVNGPCLTSKYRENTISSFMAAIEAGATFIEFDVQVTADGVPVIFHDNYLVFGESASPASSLIKDMSMGDFKNAAPFRSGMNSDSTALAGMSDEEVLSTARLPLLDGSSPVMGNSPVRGQSPVMGSSPSNSAGNFMLGGKLLRKHNNDAPAEPSEPSLHPWSVPQEDDLPTLEELFQAIPEHVGFDIEIKMTTPCHLEQTPRNEVERILDSTLEVVSRYTARGTSRSIIFSSFYPEVCLEIKKREPDRVVMFLSGGGAYPHVDPRRTSIEAAVNFASGSYLDGIILESLVTMENKLWLGYARQKGLHIMTYGLQNNDPRWVAEQAMLGVHGVIVDDVVGIYQSFFQN